MPFAVDSETLTAALMSRDPAPVERMAARLGCGTTHAHTLPIVGQVYMPCGGMPEFGVALVRTYPVQTALVGGLGVWTVWNVALLFGAFFATRRSA